jgi:hypothetical protein
MPLKHGKSRKTISHNIGEMQTPERVKKFGKAKARRMAVAAALEEARKSGARIPRVKKKKG